MIRSILLKTAAAALAFGATFGVIHLTDRDSSQAAMLPAHHRTTDELIRDYSAAIRRDPGDARGYTALGQAFVQKVRETGNTDLYDRADSLFPRRPPPRRAQRRRHRRARCDRQLAP
jgi:cytochrome c-type biogenesis protein CcmH/NrfG